VALTKEQNKSWNGDPEETGEVVKDHPPDGRKTLTWRKTGLAPRKIENDGSTWRANV